MQQPSKSNQFAESASNSLRDAYHYLIDNKAAATAFVAFAATSPVRLVKEARGFGLQEQHFEGGGIKYFSKNQINTRVRDENGRLIFRDVTWTFLLTKLLTPTAHLFLTKDSADFVADGLSRLLYRIRKHASTLHLTSGEMKEIVSGLVNEANGRLVIRRSTVRNKRQEATVSYQTGFLEHLYAEASKDDACFSSQSVWCDSPVPRPSFRPLRLTEARSGARVCDPQHVWVVAALCERRRPAVTSSRLGGFAPLRLAGRCAAM